MTTEIISLFRRLAPGYWLDGVRNTGDETDDEVERAIDCDDAFEFVIRWVHDRTGIDQADLFEAAYRLSTQAGLAPQKRQTGPETELRDLTWILPKLSELDRSGLTATSLLPVLMKYPAVAAKLGIELAASETTSAGPRLTIHQTVVNHNENTVLVNILGAKESSTPNPEANAATPAKRARGMPKKEAEEKARAFLRRHPDATAEELANGIGCSKGLVPSLGPWRAVMGERSKGRKPKAPRITPFTKKVQATTPAREEAALQSLVDEQSSDYEPSPLDPDPLPSEAEERDTSPLITDPTGNEGSFRAGRVRSRG